MAENEIEDDKNNKSSKKMIIIAALVLLIAGGGGGYYFMQEKPATEEGEPSEEAGEEEEEGREDFYYDLTQPLIVNFPKGSSASLVQVSLSFLVKGEEALVALKKHEPMIRSYLLMEISAKKPEDLMLSEGKLALRAGMLDKTNEAMMKIVNKNIVENIFFTAFVMQ